MLSTAKVFRQILVWSCFLLWLLCGVSHSSHLSHHWIISGFGEHSWPPCKSYRRWFLHLHHWPFRVITIFAWIFFSLMIGAQDVLYIWGLSYTKISDNIQYAFKNQDYWNLLSFWHILRTVTEMDAYLTQCFVPAFWNDMVKPKNYNRTDHSCFLFGNEDCYFYVL